MRVTLKQLVVSLGLIVAVSGPVAAQDGSFVRGEINQDRFVDIADVITLLLHLFQDGGSIPCEKAADVNDDGNVNITDGIFELSYLFAGGAAPPAPSGACGTDPTEDSLTCLEPPCGDLTGTLIISEIMASNLDTIADEDQDYSDWLEIHMLSSSQEAAVDLGGYYLTGNPDNLTAWQFPDGVVLSPGDFLLVFCSGKDRVDPDSELHTSFRLDSDGEYLALVGPDGSAIIDEFAPAFPEQRTDVSYGPAQTTSTLVEIGDPVRYHVPTAADSALGDSWADPDFADGGWSVGTTGLGFSDIVTESFEVTYMKANIVVDHLDDAVLVLNNPARRTQTTTATAEYIDFYNSGGRGNFSNDNAFPGIGFSDIDDFVVHVTGSVLIPEAGRWSFGVNSDDGFGLELTNGEDTFSMIYALPRGPNDTINVFNITQPGRYDLDLLYYERGGGAELELFAAQGGHLGFNSNDFRLVGDAANGGLGLVGFADDVSTDVEGPMRTNNASIWSRIDFNVDSPGSVGGMALRMKYEDGFVAYINGTEVARRNAPGVVSWNSSASEDRDLQQVSVTDEINLSGRVALLRSGNNVLAIHGLNDSASDGNFLISPELVVAGNIAERQYMVTPTPGTFNVAGSVDFVRSIQFSEEHGFFDGEFPLTLSTETDGAQIRFTTNGSTPTASTGTVYSRPLNIGRTTVIRAAGFKPGYLESDVATSSYIFVSDVIRQSPTGARPGPEWPTGRVNGQDIDYGMDPAIVGDARWSGLIEDALLSIPSLSLVTEVGNFFNSSTGIYVNARNDGRAWERPTNAELLLPDGSPGFNTPAGVRIRGAFSRSGDNPKHSLRLFFRKEYGAGKLRYPFYGGEGADEFDSIDLRTSQNYSWAFSGDGKNTFIRDVWSRDTMREMRQDYTRSRYLHIYINGVYWGLYQTEERADADFARTYLGGREDDYDVIKNNSSGSRALHATDGNMVAYRALYDAASGGFSSDALYRRVLGQRSDGTNDPNRDQLLDPENLMDYMICTYYTGDPDAPLSVWGHISNNVFAIYDRVNPQGFKWFRHDAEHSLGANGGLNEGRLLTNGTDRTIGQQWQHFNPAWLHIRLTANDEYRMQFCDRANEYFFNDGILSSSKNIERWNRRRDSIDLAVIGASARWGDAQRGTPRNRNDWLGESSWLTGTFFPQRTQIVLNQMRGVNMFPDTAIASFNQHGGEVEAGFTLVMTQGNGDPGTIYYTTDGSDPRLGGGGLNPAAEVFEDDSAGTTLVAAGSVWSYLDDGSDQGAAWRQPDFDDTDWESGPAQLGYGDNDEETVVGFGPDDDDKYATTYFRHSFIIDDASAVVSLTVGLLRDDGGAVYLNGEEVVRQNLAADAGYLDYASGGGVPVGGASEDTFYSTDVDAALLVDGTNVLAVEIHQGSGTSSDISFDLRLSGVVAGGESSTITINESTTVKARVRAGGEWGALTSALFTVGIEGLVINEFMVSNGTGLEDPDEPGEHPDWIELYNGTPNAIDLGGMYLSDDPLDLEQWRISDGVVIPAFDYLVFFADDDGTQGALHTNYQLSESGETILLVHPDARTVIDEIEFGPQVRDVSYGRFEDGADTWGFHIEATPGLRNRPHSR